MGSDGGMMSYVPRHKMRPVPGTRQKKRKRIPGPARKTRTWSKK